MRAEIIALGLKQVGREPFAAIPVVEGQGRADCRHRNPFFRRDGDHVAPGALALPDCFFEKRIQEQVHQPGIFIKRLLDLAKECASDNAAPAPHQCDPAVVQVPVVFFRRGAHQHVSLRVADDFGRV